MLREKLEAMAAAVAFAECGDWETAQEIMRERRTERPSDRQDKRPQKSERPRATVRM